MRGENEFVNGGEERPQGSADSAPRYRKWKRPWKCDFAMEFLDWDVVLYLQMIPK
jgi:hypothetical protein